MLPVRISNLTGALWSMPVMGQYPIDAETQAIGVRNLANMLASLKG